MNCARRPGGRWSAGNARLRVFAGTYRITARLPDGSTADTTLLLPAGSGERMVVLQPLKIVEKRDE